MTRQDRSILYAFACWMTANYTNPMITGSPEFLTLLYKHKREVKLVKLDGQELLERWKLEVYRTYSADSTGGTQPKRNKQWRAYLHDKTIIHLMDDFEHMFLHVFNKYLEEEINK